MSKTGRFIFGTPIPTGAVEIQVPLLDSVPYFRICDNNSLLYHMSDDTVVYGLGPHVRGLNKRGWIYESFNSDESMHSEEKRKLYGSHNYLLIGAGKPFGVFIDTPGLVTFDIGYTHLDELRITVRDGNYTLYVFEAESLTELAKSLRKLTGPSYVPPLWAFGFNQSRWSYFSADEVRKVLSGYRQASMPIDMITLDIDYMDHYKDFTVDQERFPDFENFVQELDHEHIHLVPIIDAGVKAEAGYPVYDECIAGKYFCQREDGSPFYLGVWPGKCVFPDFLNPEAASWFGRKYKTLTELGIRGFWNDMNEPAIFFSESRLKDVLEKLSDFAGKNLDLAAFSEMKSLITTLSNRDDYTREFYHNLNGLRVPNEVVHNLFGFAMSRAAAFELKNMYPNERMLLFSRSSFIGLHRYAGIWYGDNRSWWSQLKLNICQAADANMSGFLYSGADIGGFNGNATEDLLLRWLAFGIFMPLCRNHTALNTRQQEFYRFENTAAFRNLLRLRYAMIPFIYSEVMKAAVNDDMYFKPLSFVYPADRRAKNVQDQLIVGDSIMIAPVYEQNADGRYVYLPESMRLYRMRSVNDYDTEVLETGNHYLACSLNEVLVFVRPGHALPLTDSEHAQSTFDLDMQALFAYKYDDHESIVYEQYLDDCVTWEFNKARYLRKHVF